MIPIREQYNQFKASEKRERNSKLCDRPRGGRELMGHCL